ncbi:MAG TPA: hypothetical protein VMI54_04255 [Polyangiaceae bacterium]|nr:hypothetical protein [Polyangiaceae bacterium]
MASKKKIETKSPGRKPYRGGTGQLNDAVRVEVLRVLRERGIAWSEAHERHLRRELAWPEYAAAKKQAAKLLGLLTDLAKTPDAIPAPVVDSVRWLAEFPVFVPRQRLVVMYNRRGARWWWGVTGPRSRDLAMLSILAGNIPDSSSKHETSPLEIIEQEERAINEAKRARFRE